MDSTTLDEKAIALKDKVAKKATEAVKKKAEDKVKQKLKKKSKFEEEMDAAEARFVAPNFEKTKDGRHWRLKK